jgi:hypothetical protein
MSQRTKIARLASARSASGEGLAPLCIDIGQHPGCAFARKGSSSAYA